jgi:hypothetical protein
MVVTWGRGVLVKQDNTIWCAADVFCELTAFIIADVARRGTDLHREVKLPSLAVPRFSLPIGTQSATENTHSRRYGPLHWTDRTTLRPTDEYRSIARTVKQA